MDENVVAEYGQHRVRLETEDYPERPYDDGSAPIWRVGFRSTSPDARHEEGLSSYEPDPCIAEAIGRFWSDDDTLERYLRIFHGVTVTERWHSGSDWYLTCDPASWREAMGITEEATRAEGYGDHLMDEYQAWCNGEVYVVVVDQKARKTSMVTTPDGVDVLEELVDDDYWHQVDSLGGHYGYEWAQQAALDLLTNYEPEILATCPECEWAEVVVEERARFDAQFRHMVDVHQWRTHRFWYEASGRRFTSPRCQRGGCDVMGTGDWYNDGECTGDLEAGEPGFK